MTASPQNRSTTFGWLIPSLLLIVFLAIIAAGYSVFRLFVSSVDANLTGLYLFAVVAGVASFFSPCAFPLLPSYFSFYQGNQDSETVSSNGFLRLLRFGGAAALGVVAFDLILGVMIALLGEGVAQGLSIAGADPNQLVLAFRGLVGLFLLVLGVGQLRGWNLKPRIADIFAYQTRPQREGGRGPTLNLFLYGLGYNAAGMGCTGPILAGLMILAIASGGFGTTLTAFGIFSLTMGALMVMVSGLVVALQNSMVLRLKRATPWIQQGSSIILVLVGIFNLYSAIEVQSFVRLLFPN